MEILSLLLAIKCTAAIVEVEAKGEIYEGKVAVAEVLFNRASKVPAQVCEQSRKPYQFAKPATNISKQSYQAAIEVLIHGRRETEGATYFIAPKRLSVKPRWISNLKLVKVIGNHEFYAEVPRRRSKTLSNGFEGS